MQAPPLLEEALRHRAANRRQSITSLAPTPIYRQQAMEPNRLDEVGRLYINVDNDDVMDSLAPFKNLLPNNETARMHQMYGNTPQNREQMMLANLIQLKRELKILRERVYVLENARNRV
tara:strand:+ start:117 stop:473 length:357 start_codon:yes stop_codon:yes gene_type:complete